MNFEGEAIMTTSFLEEQKLRLETLLQDLSVRRQQLEAKNLPPPSGFLPSPSQTGVFGDSVPAPSNLVELDVKRIGSPSLSNKD
jgi:hypothetical protein